MTTYPVELRTLYNGSPVLRGTIEASSPAEALARAERSAIEAGMIRPWPQGSVMVWVIPARPAKEMMQ